jgi:hypothetical protein
MTFPEGQFSGSLYSAVGEESQLAWEQIPGLAIQEMEVRGWYSLKLTVSTSLISNEPWAKQYEYYFLLRRSGRRFLLASAHADLDEHRLIARGVGKIGAIKPTIDIPRMVGELTQVPGRYVMSAVWARVEGFGQTLRAIALYGTDLAASTLFTGILPQLVPHRVQLRDVATRAEILSVASRGEVGFSYSSSRSLRGVDSALSFLSHRGYLEWSKVDVGDEGSK